MPSDRKDLKIQALLETINRLENQVADLRVELTVVNQELAEQLSAKDTDASSDEN